MKNRLSKAIAIFLTFCVAFSGLPFLAGNLEVNALAKKKKLPKNITLQAAVSGQTQVDLKWNKIKSPSKGYAVFRDGQAVAHFNTKKVTFTDSDLKAGTSYMYQIKTYTKKTVKMWFNKKTEKWQKKKPAKKYRGKSKKEAVYTYKKKSNAVTIHTAAAPAPSTPSNPSDIGDNDNDGNNGGSDGNSGNDNTGNDNTGNNNGTSGNSGNDNSDSAQTTYTITWVNWNGKVLATGTVKAGEVPSYSGTPKRAADDNIYDFTGWSPAVVAANDDATYTAQFKATPRYTITWKDWDGTTLRTDTVKQGIKPVYPGTPSRPEDDAHTYTFSGWSPTVTAADKNATYIAQYEVTAKSGSNEVSEDALAYTLVGPTELRKGETYEYTILESVPAGITLKWEVLPYFMTYEAVNDKTIRISVPEDDLSSVRIVVSSIKNDGTEIKSADEMIPVVRDSEKEGHAIGKAKENPTCIACNGAPDESGNNTLTYTFYTNGGIDWTKKNYDISVEDVTPEAYREALSQLNCSGGLDYNAEFEECICRVEEADDKIQFVDCTKVTITIKAGPAVRVVKVYDKKGHQFDRYWEMGSAFADEADMTVYISPADHEFDDGYDKVYQFYEDLYAKARRSVEKQLWISPSMTTKEKLAAISEYINNTAHYPGSPATSKANNPEFWNKWAYDGVALYYDSFHCPYLNRIMKLHGGITDCLGQSIVVDVATEDLGLEYIYDAENEVVLDKEGVWTGQGKYSSNPSEPGHYTCIYKDANGSLCYIDVQGMFNTCAEHDCESKILDFSKGLN